MRKQFLFLFIFLLTIEGWCQRKDVFSIMEDSIVQLHKSVISERNTILRYQKNEQLLALIEETLDMHNSMSYSFNVLKTISVLTSPDRKVRIFTWYLTDDKGVHEHYGFLQAYNEEKREYRLYMLVDKWQRINNPAAQVLTCGNWYGALYTELIQTTASEKTYYTLLGWNGGNVLSQRKVIEVLSLNNKGIPSFGALIFKGYTKSRTMRIVFEYARRSPLMLRYDKQLYTQRSDKKDKKTKKYITDTLSANMIVWNRLIPMDESLQQIPQFMVGEASLNDAFLEKDGKWVFKPNIIARNPETSGGKNGKSEKSDKQPKPHVKPRVFYTPVQ
ncbi:MAG: hypothetical protein LBQ64_02950 [Bacteroidales bacterium]|jgi:hypothetical protein|nr:hypothetical protein [Bacteroidales bacterium]